MANALAVGTTEAATADIVIAVGSSATVSLMSSTDVIPQYAVALIQKKDSGGNYETVGQLDGLGAQNVMKVIQSAGTFRVLRKAFSAGVPFGIDLN